MAIYDELDTKIKHNKQKLNNNHIRNLKIMNILNLLVMLFMILIDIFLIFKGIFTGMPDNVMALLITFLVLQIGSLIVFSIKRFARASMVTKVGIMIICFMPIIPYIIYLNIGSNIYLICLISRIIGLISLAMLLFNTKTTNDKKTFSVKGTPLAIASLVLLFAIIYVLFSTSKRKIIYEYDKLYDGYVLTDVLSGKGDVEIADNAIAISNNSLKNVDGNLVIPKNVKYVLKDAFINSNIESLEIYSSDIEIMDAINNSNINKIYLCDNNINIDISKLNKDIDIITDRTLIDNYRNKYRKYDYLFIPQLNDDEYFVEFNGTNLPVEIYKEEKEISEPDKSKLPTTIDGKDIIYDGYFIDNKEINFPINVNKNTKIACKYNQIFDITYDFSGADDNYNLPLEYYNKLGEIDLPQLNLDGYRFKGWYSIDEYGNYTKEYKKLDNNIDNDLKLKAKFLKEFNLNYNKILSDSTLEYDSKIFTEEDEIEFIEPKLDGFTFEGWYLDESYTILASTYINKDTNLYAKWKINNKINLSSDINKTFDNELENVNIDIETKIPNVLINYEFYDIDDNLIASNNSFNVLHASDSNKYYAKVILNYNNLVINEIKTDYINVNIEKTKYDMSGISLNDATYTYDGTEHMPTLTGQLPKGIDNITINYKFNEGIKYVGKKEIECEFLTLSNDYEIPSSLKAYVTIEPRIITIDWQDDLEFEYDGNMKFPEYKLINVLQSDKDLIDCETSGSANGVGKYIAKITSLKAKVIGSEIYKNYNLTTDTTNLNQNYSIVSRVNWISGINVENTEFVYDGKEHTPNVTIERSDVVAIYSYMPTNVGTYDDIVVTFKYLNNDNENIGNTYQATVIIKPREIDLSFSFKEITYDALPHIPEYSINNVIDNDSITLNYSYINSINAGTYSIDYISIEGKSKDNYTLPEVKKYEYTINPEEVFIDLENLGFEDMTYTYNGKNQYPLINKSNLPNNVTVTYEGYGKDAGIYNVVARFNINSTNYVIDKNSKSISINVEIKPIVASIKWGQTTFVYDGKEHIPTATVNNLVLGDTCNVIVICLNLAIDASDKYIATAKTLDNKNYTLEKEESIGFVIEQKDYDFIYLFKDITVTYDGNFHRPSVKFVESEKPDWLDINYSSEGIKDAGVMTVTATFVSNDPAYKVPEEPISATVTITALEAEIEFTLTDNIYNATAIYPKLSVKNKQNDDNPEVILNAVSNNILVGNYMIYSNQIEILDNNYKVPSTINYSYEIKKATYDISNIKFEDITVTYDGLRHFPTISAVNENTSTEIVGLDGYTVQVSYSEGLINVGSKIVTVTFQVSTNYNQIPSMNATVYITPKEVTLKWNGDSFVYTGSVIKPECILSGLVLNDTCGYTINAQGVNVGEYVASISNLDNPNYKLPADFTHKYQITQATLSLSGISFNPTQKVYDSTPLYPEVIGEIPNNVEVIYEGLNSNSGIHPITIKFIVSANYKEISPKVINVEILKREVSINWLNLEAEYTGMLSYPSYELNNVISGDECILTFTGGGIEVGEYNITISGLSNENYIINDTEGITYRIVKANYDMKDIKFDDLEAIYNGLEQTPKIQGILPQGVSVTYSSGAINVSEGIKTVTATFITQDDNYNAPQPLSATIKILPKELNISWSNTVCNYDGNKHTPTATLSGFIGEDSATITLSGYGIDAGTYEIEVASISNTNYIINNNSSVNLIINKIDYDMSGIKFVDATYTYDKQIHQQTISGVLSSVLGLDGISPTVKSYTGSVLNVSDGEVKCVVEFDTKSQNYNIPDSMECIIKVEPIVLDLTITLDTDSSVLATTQAWTNSYRIDINYDGINHNVNITPDSTKIFDGDLVEFMVDKTFKNYNGGNPNQLNIISSNSNYTSTYKLLNAYVSRFSTGYNWNWNSLTANWWNGADPTKLVSASEDVALIYQHTTLDDVVYQNELPKIYGSYKLKYESLTENVVINNPQYSSKTYDVELNTSSLDALIDYYDSNNDGYVTDCKELFEIEYLYNKLGISNTEIENLINDSYTKVLENALTIKINKAKSSNAAEVDNDICSVSGSIKSGVASKDYHGIQFDYALKMETATKLVVDLSNSNYSYVILVTDAPNKYLKINGSTFQIDSEGILNLIIEEEDTEINIARSNYEVHIYGIILIP